MLTKLLLGLSVVSIFSSVSFAANNNFSLEDIGIELKARPVHINDDRCMEQLKIQKDRVLRLREQVKTCQDDSQALKHSNDRLTEMNSDLNNQVNNINHDLMVCKRELEQASHHKPHDNGELEQLKEENRKLMFEIRELRKENKYLKEQLENNHGNDHDGNHHDRISKIYGCDNSDDTQMLEYIVDQNGDILRENVVKTFTVGYDEDEKMACRQEVLSKKHEINFGERTACICDNSSGDSDIVLQILDRKYQVIKSFTLGRFVEGLDDEEKRNCQNETRTNPLCNINY